MDEVTKMLTLIAAIVIALVIVFKIDWGNVAGQWHGQ